MWHLYLRWSSCPLNPKFCNLSQLSWNPRTHLSSLSNPTCLPWMIIGRTTKYPKWVIVLSNLSGPYFQRRFLPSIVDEGNLLMWWQTHTNVSAQNFFDKSKLDNIQRTFSSKVMFILSDSSFCWCVSLTVKCLSMPSLWHNYRKGSLVYSPPLFEQSNLIVLPVFFSIFFFHSIINSRTFPLCLMVYTQYCLGRSPNIRMNIVKDPLGAMNHDAEFHLVFLLMMQLSQSLNLQVLAPLNKPCFARTCKGFSPIYSSLMCHNRVQSSSELIKVVTCPITVLPFK